MIRVLVMIAVAGFIVSIATLSTAVALGGPDFFADSAWRTWAHNGRWDWADDHDWGSHRHWGHDYGPQTTREIAWSGGDSLDVDVPADVTYTQAPGPGKLTVTGPQREVEALEIDNGHLGYSHGHRHWGGLTIVMTAPAVSRFSMNGSGKLVIEGYKQDKLSLDLSGDADVSAKGEARNLDLQISGSSDSDLSGLKVENAEVNISGSGQTTLAPTGSADLSISGSGDITLLSHPAKLQSHVSGSGSINQEDRSSTGPAAPAPPVKPAKAGKSI